MEWAHPIFSAWFFTLFVPSHCNSQLFVFHFFFLLPRRPRICSHQYVPRWMNLFPLPQLGKEPIVVEKAFGTFTWSAGLLGLVVFSKRPWYVRGQVFHYERWMTQFNDMDAISKLVLWARLLRLLVQYKDKIIKTIA